MEVVSANKDTDWNEFPPSLITIARTEKFRAFLEAKTTLTLRSDSVCTNCVDWKKKKAGLKFGHKWQASTDCVAQRSKYVQE
jgi:hypothetical protein